MSKFYAKEFFDTDNHISSFKYSNNEIIFYKNNECIMDLGLKFPIIDLGECSEKIQETIGSSDKPIIAILAQKIEGNDFFSLFSVYSPHTGNNINIKNICENIKINVKKFINYSKIENSYSIEKLIMQGIDVFDLSSKFYNDFCFLFESPFNQDIAMNDRIKFFYPDISLYEINCYIKSIDIYQLRAEYICSLDDLMDDIYPWPNEVLVLEPYFYDSNIIEIIKCGPQMLKNNFATYPGFIIISSLILIQIVLTIIHFIKGITPLRKYLYIIFNSYSNFIKKEENEVNEPPKKGNTLHCLEINNNNKNMKNYKDKTINKNNSTKSKNLVIKNQSCLRTLNIIDNNTGKVGKKKLGKKKNKNIQNDEINFRMNEIAKEIENDDESKSSFDIKEYLETDLEDMTFEEVKEKDNRKFCAYYKERLISNLLIINIIIQKEPFKPRTIKLFLFLISIDLYFLLNALYIDEEFISELFQLEYYTTLEIILEKDLFKLFISSVVEEIVNYIIDFFFIDEKKVKVVLKSKKIEINEKKEKLDKIIEKTKRRFIYFIIFSFLLTLFSLYYITCFNYKYRYIWILWIISSIVNIIFKEILNILAPLAETCIRFLSFKLNNEKLYKLSLYIW